MRRLFFVENRRMCPLRFGSYADGLPVLCYLDLPHHPRQLCTSITPSNEEIAWPPIYLDLCTRSHARRTLRIFNNLGRITNGLVRITRHGRLILRRQLMTQICASPNEFFTHRCRYVVPTPQMIVYACMHIALQSCFTCGTVPMYPVSRILGQVYACT